MENKEFLIKVGIEVRVARLRKQLTIRELCKASGLSFNCIIDVENGKRSAGVIILKRIAEALSVSMKDFFIFTE